MKWKHKKSFKKPFWFVVQCPGQSLFSSQVIIWSRRQIDVVKRFANRYGEGGTNTRAPPPPDTSIMGGQPWLPKLRSCGHFATKLTIIRCQDHAQYTSKSRFVFNLVDLEKKERFSFRIFRYIKLSLRFKSRCRCCCLPQDLYNRKYYLFLPTIAEFAPCEPLAVAGIVAGVRQLCGQAETSPANTVDKGGQVSCN